MPAEGEQKDDADKARKTGFVLGFDSKKRTGAPGVKRAVPKTGVGGQAWLRPGARKARAHDRKF